MRASLVVIVFRVLTWCCVVFLAVLSLWPGRGLGFLFVLPELNTLRTGLPGQLEHLIAYAGSAAIGMAGYGASRGGARVIGGFWVYAAILEYLQHFSPDRHPAFADFAASAFGALCGGLAVAFLWQRPFDQPS
jgi:VanZ family protein